MVYKHIAMPRATLLIQINWHFFLFPTVIEARQVIIDVFLQCQAQFFGLSTVASQTALLHQEDGKAFHFAYLNCEAPLPTLCPSP